MAPPVNTSSYRQLQAQQTRERIAEAARRLFAARGYRATSMDAIAAEAGVAARTVYSAFGAKREILSAICERWLEEARARELAQAAVAEPDPRSRLRAAAHWLRTLYEAGFDVVTLFAAASDEDAETRALLQAKLAGRNQVMDMIVASLDGALRVPVPQAQAIYRALAAPGVYGELVVESGWAPDAFEEWVADALIRELLDPDPSRRE
ncbi:MULTISPECIES: TetR/AcrR family transcriptional regulator [Pseudofrankia]|uniref:TetR/AcrR family transcriptional regulator n=1 Tax=Pseudofrankia TaxID=2994363 RepID=UPI000234CDCD|nr:MULTISPECIES: TetR/AcrR family transcriptional regulator [Pseudofrankia]OHV35292.1 TetR family transcriptional regulator [Pseudofrankia sp. EUN1h]